MEYIFCHSLLSVMIEAICIMSHILSNWLVIEPIKYKGLYRRQKKTIIGMIEKNPVMKKKCRILSNEQSLIIKKTGRGIFLVSQFSCITLFPYHRLCVTVIN